MSDALPPEYIEAAATVFGHDDPFAERFVQPGVGAVLLYPVNYILDDSTIEAVVDAAQTLGTKHMFLRYREGLTDEDHMTVWRVSPTTESYRAIASEPYEHLLVGCDGKWGVVTTHEDFALVAGCREFLQIFSPALTVPPEQQLTRFVRDMQTNRDRGLETSWVPVVVESVLGQEEARELLSDARW